jgi:hypothetical protein
MLYHSMFQLTLVIWEICLSYSWEKLRDIREMQEYNMAVAYDPNRQKHLMPGAIARRYITQTLVVVLADC